MENNHVTILEIDLDAIDFNLNYFKSLLKDNTEVLVVLKAFGYGSDALEVARHLETKVAYFAVAYSDEGIWLRNNGIETPILVLHPQKENLKALFRHKLEPNIYSFSLFEELINLDKLNSDVVYPIHLKFNTGLNRLGFTAKDLLKIQQLLSSNQAIELKSVFSHIAASEDLNEQEFSLKQIREFDVLSTQLSKGLGRNFKRHMLNTSGIINFSSPGHYDMVRLGIGLFGFGNQKEVTLRLKSVLKLKSVISQIHIINPGESVGYNRGFFASKTMRTATIPIGHADGISRNLGNGKGVAFVNGKKAHYVGNVCMDMIMIDVTNIACNEGDEVIIYRDAQHMEDLAANIDTIPYELLTAISQRVKRILKKC